VSRADLSLSTALYGVVGMIPLFGAAKSYKAGVLAAESCPQRLHVKPLGRFAKTRKEDRKSNKVR